MKKNLKTIDFETLKDEWYQRLKEEGFVDIEQTNSINTSIPYNLRRYSEYNKTLMELNQEYYTMTSTFLNTYEFENELEKIIWEYYSEGLSFRDISKVLKQVNIRMSKDKVWRIINRLEKIMKKMYLSL